MATVQPGQIRGRRSRATTAVFSAIGLMLVYVLVHTEHFLVDPADPVWAHYRVVGQSLLLHGVTGAAALLLALAQFSTRLRTRAPRLHRVCGRIYVVAVLISAPLGAYVGYLDEASGHSRSFTMATVVNATLWIAATLMALWCIRRKKLEQHRQWMTRSFAMALVFLEVRVILGLTGWENIASADEIVVWVVVALAYPLADLVLQIGAELRLGTKQPISA